MLENQRKINNMNKLNKKAQVSEAIPWLVSTLIIITFLGITLIITHKFQDEKIVYYDKTKDIFLTKSAISYILSPDPEFSDKLVYEQLQENSEQFKIDEKKYVLLSDLIFMNLHCFEECDYSRKIEQSFLQPQAPRIQLLISFFRKGFYISEKYPYTLDEILLIENKFLTIYKSYSQ